MVFDGLEKFPGEEKVIAQIEEQSYKKSLCEKRSSGKAVALQFSFGISRVNSMRSDAIQIVGLSAQCFIVNTTTARKSKNGLTHVSLHNEPIGP